MIVRKPQVTEEKFLRGKGANNGAADGIRRINFRLPDELYNRLRNAAFDSRTNMNALVVEILEDALAKGRRKKSE